MTRHLTAGLACVILSTAAAAAPEGWGGPDRHAVLIASNSGEPGEPDLQFAERDALKLHRVLEQLGGFRPENVTLVLGRDADQARRAIIAVNDRVRSTRDEHGRGALLLVYYSGHGDTEALHLGPSRLDLYELEQLVRGSAATTRLLVVDACRSGALTQVKGGAPVPPFEITVDDTQASDGVVFLTSATLGEAAQESAELGGSFFTHHLVSGLRGAADRDDDGQVLLEEAYHHAYRFTLRDSSRTLAGAQHPTFRYDLRGRGELILTRLDAARGRRARLGLPPGFDFFVLVEDASGAVVAEVSAASRGRALALPPGRYFLRGRGRRVLLEGEVELSPGEVRTVAVDSLRRTAYARLVRKGDGGVVAARAVEVGYWVRTPLWPTASPCHGVHTGYRFAFRYLTLIPRVRACRSGFENDHLVARANELEIGLRAAYVFDLPLVSVGVGTGLGGALLRQGFDTPGMAPDRTTPALHIDVGVGLELDLPTQFLLVGELEVRTYLFPQWTPRGESTLATPLVGGGLVGLGKRF